MIPHELFDFFVATSLKGDLLAVVGETFSQEFIEHFLRKTVRIEYNITVVLPYSSERHINTKSLAESLLEFLSDHFLQVAGFMDEQNEGNELFRSGLSLPSCSISLFFVFVDHLRPILGCYLHNGSFHGD